MLDPVQVERYGKLVWEVQALEPLRKEACMCHRCGSFKPGSDTNCVIAEKFFAVCKDYGNAFILTRCVAWTPKKGGGDA